MLKAYAVKDLHPGMTIGKDVVGNDAAVLAEAGKVLDDPTIAMLGEKKVFSVEIWEPDLEQLSEPAKEVLLDNSYVGIYQKAYDTLDKILSDLVTRGNFDTASLDALFDEGVFETLCDGAKAVSQIHNMSRKGKYITHHNLGVGILAGLMGNWLHYDEAARRELITAGLFIDAGKMKISDAILNKKGRLTPTEYGIVMNHPKFSYEMLLRTDLGTNQNILYGVLQHHERNDGSGYPYHISAAQITVYGRILGIIDVYDAMAADRAYAKRSSPFDIFSIINDDVIAGRFDTEYGILFMRQICHALNGNWVRLSTGASGRIVYMDESRVTSLPVVQTTEGDFVDLNTNHDINIEYIMTAEEVAKLENN